MNGPRGCRRFAVVLFDEAKTTDRLPWSSISRLEVSHGRNVPLETAASFVGLLGGAALSSRLTQGLSQSSCPQQIVCSSDLNDTFLRLGLSSRAQGLGSMSERRLAAVSDGLTFRFRIV